MHLRSEQVLIDGGSVSHQAEVFLFHSTNTPGANPDDSATIKSAVSNRWFDGAGYDSSAIVSPWPDKALHLTVQGGYQ